MRGPPATVDEVVELIGNVDSSYLERIRDTGASVDEIGEAIDLFDARIATYPEPPSSIAVAVVREILDELAGDGRQPPVTFPIRAPSVVRGS